MKDNETESDSRNSKEHSVRPIVESSDANMSELVATAYHEAGHAVMALTLGRAIQKVTIAPGQMQTGGQRLGACEIKKGRLKPAQDGLEDDILILFAGMVAESRVTHRYCQRGASLDLRAARRLIATRANTQRQLEKLERRLLDKAEHLFADAGHAKAIELIALELMQKETISGRAARHFFEQAIAQFS